MSDTPLQQALDCAMAARTVGTQTPPWICCVCGLPALVQDTDAPAALAALTCWDHHKDALQEIATDVCGPGLVLEGLERNGHEFLAIYVWHDREGMTNGR